MQMIEVEHDTKCVSNEVFFKNPPLRGKDPVNEEKSEPNQLLEMQADKNEDEPSTADD